ncbi:MAG: hypothetical protein IPK99_13720 [Flavobacteriales bacterium]|nr:hypothetical protein [Flavobacteriales bacterium]
MAKAIVGVDDAETIARYVFFSDEVRADGTPRPKLFEPDRHHECSVFRTDGLSKAEVQRIGDVEVSPNYNKLPYGHCDLFVGQVRSKGEHAGGSRGTTYAPCLHTGLRAGQGRMEVAGRQAFAAGCEHRAVRAVHLLQPTPCGSSIHFLSSWL